MGFVTEIIIVSLTFFLVEAISFPITTAINVTWSKDNPPASSDSEIFQGVYCCSDFLPDTEREVSSSDPEKTKHLGRRKYDESFSLLHRIGEYHYKSKLNNHIYHLSGWNEGESSIGRRIEDCRELKRLRKSQETTIGSDLRSIYRTDSHAIDFNDSIAESKPVSTQSRKEKSLIRIWKPPWSYWED